MENDKEVVIQFNVFFVCSKSQPSMTQGGALKQMFLILTSNTARQSLQFLLVIKNKTTHTRRHTKCSRWNGWFLNDDKKLTKSANQQHKKYFFALASFRSAPKHLPLNSDVVHLWYECSLTSIQPNYSQHSVLVE